MLYIPVSNFNVDLFVGYGRQQPKSNLSHNEVVFTLIFFFSSRRRHTRSLCDWSSDVCSSDLARVQTLFKRRAERLRNEKYQAVPELVKAMAMLERGKFKKMVAFTYSEAAERVRSEERRVGKEGRCRWAGCE